MNAVIEEAKTQDGRRTGKGTKHVLILVYMHQASWVAFTIKCHHNDTRQPWCSTFAVYQKSSNSDILFKFKTKIFVNTQSPGQKTFVDAIHGKFCFWTATLHCPTFFQREAELRTALNFYCFQFPVHLQTDTGELSTAIYKPLMYKSDNVGTCQKFLWNVWCKRGKTQNSSNQTCFYLLV